MHNYKIAVLPGDGIGIDVIKEAKVCLREAKLLNLRYKQGLVVQIGREVVYYEF